MGLLDWWRASREKAELTRRSIAINDDQEAIQEHVPELTGMTDVEGMAYTMRQIDEWNATFSQEEAATFAGRLMASNDSWNDQGLTMPYWSNLWVLRTYQAELGRDVPAVSPPRQPD